MPVLGNLVDDVLSFQWEVKYDPVWQHGGKAFQIECGGGSLGIEIQANMFPMDRSIPSNISNYQLLHSVRVYIGGTGAIIGGNNNPEQLSTGPYTQRNVQPPLYARIRQMQQGVDNPGHVGEGGQAYFVRPGQWVRYTLSWDLSVNPARLKVWIADENTDPTLIMADENDNSLGFICEPRPERRSVKAIRMPEFNNSSTNAPVDSTTLIRNVVVWKGAEIPLGGRP
jgi:hypothetical protein